MALPQLVLVEQLSEVLRNRTVEAAVFTTFNFDPGFFELYVLPALFPNQKFSAVEKVRLLQLEDQLRSLEQLAVYFDASALAHDAATPRLAYSRIDMHWRTGVFHPKLILLLVADPTEGSHTSLIVGCQSANLTRGGWWENVECARFEEVLDKESTTNPCPFRDDLITFIDRIQSRARYENHDTLNRIRDFLTYRVEQTTRETMASMDARPTRLFGGSDRWSFAEWLVEEAQQYEGWNLEIVSPYFDANHANALKHLIESTKARAVRVFLPEANDGTALVSETVYEAVDELENVEWARIPGNVVARRGAVAADKVAPRFVHAKLYRFWRAGYGDLMVVGSVNCTTPAHGAGHQGNLEAGFFVDVADQRFGRKWWLEVAEDKATGFTTEEREESDGNDHQPFDVYLKYNWAEHQASILVDGDVGFPLQFKDLANATLFTVDSCHLSEWTTCNEQVANALRESLGQSSFVMVTYGDSTWRLLVREDGHSHRPSLLTELTADEIFRYWSMLSDEQRTDFLEKRVSEKVEGLDTKSREVLRFEDSVFHQFSGIFHAFGHFQRRIKESLSAQLEMDAEWRMFGAKYDSLPELLRKVFEAEQRDPVMVYVTFLCAKQVRNWVVKQHGSFAASRSSMLDELDELIARGLAVRDEIELDQNGQDKQFLDWYEAMFLREFAS